MYSQHGVMLTLEGYLFIEPLEGTKMEGTDADNMAEQAHKHVVYRQPGALKSSEQKCSSVGKSLLNLIC